MSIFFLIFNQIAIWINFIGFRIKAIFSPIWMIALLSQLTNESLLKCTVCNFQVDFPKDNSNNISPYSETFGFWSLKTEKLKYNKTTYFSNSSGGACFFFVLIAFLSLLHLWLTEFAQPALSFPQHYLVDFYRFFKKWMLPLPFTFPGQSRLIRPHFSLLLKHSVSLSW